MGCRDAGMPMAMFVCTRYTALLSINYSAGPWVLDLRSTPVVGHNPIDGKVKLVVNGKVLSFCYSSCLSVKFHVWQTITMCVVYSEPTFIESTWYYPQLGFPTIIDYWVIIVIANDHHLDNWLGQSNWWYLDYSYDHQQYLRMITLW